MQCEALHGRKRLTLHPPGAPPVLGAITVGEAVQATQGRDHRLVFGEAGQGVAGKAGNRRNGRGR